METEKVVKKKVEKKAVVTDDETIEIIENLVEGYLDSYGMAEFDYDKIFEYIRSANDDEEIAGYGDIDYAQMVMDKLLTMKDEEEEETEEKTKIVRNIGKADGKLDCICNISLIRNFIKKINIDDEAKLHIDEKGISCCIVDSSHVMMVKASIPKSEFYAGKDVINRVCQYSVDKPFAVGIDIIEFDHVLRLISGGFDRIHLLIQDNDVIVETMNDKPLRKRMVLLDTMGMRDMNMPTLELDIEAKIERSEISLLQKATAQEGVDRIELISDGHTLKAVITNDSNEGDLTLVLSKTTKGTGKSFYSPDYLNRFLSSITENKPITIQFKSDNPIKISGKLQDNGEYYALIAPRIERD